MPMYLVLVALEVVQCVQRRPVNRSCLLCVYVCLQLATAQASVDRLQQQVTAGQPEMASLRARVEQLDKELQEAKVRMLGASGRRACVLADCDEALTGAWLRARR